MSGNPTHSIKEIIEYLNKKQESILNIIQLKQKILLKQDGIFRLEDFKK